MYYSWDHHGSYRGHADVKWDAPSMSARKGWDRLHACERRERRVFLRVELEQLVSVYAVHTARERRVRRKRRRASTHRNGACSISAITRRVDALREPITVREFRCDWGCFVYPLPCGRHPWQTCLEKFNSTDIYHLITVSWANTTDLLKVFYYGTCHKPNVLTIS